jgi:hypothetical protein
MESVSFLSNAIATKHLILWEIGTPQWLAAHILNSNYYTQLQQYAIEDGKLGDRQDVYPLEDSPNKIGEHPVCPPIVRQRVR